MPSRLAPTADRLLLAGTANPALAASVARELGVSLGACGVERFADGELSVHLDEPVRGRTVIVVQPTAPPVNDNLLELVAFADACRRAGAARVVAVVPYFGYARADRRDGRREPITASLVADFVQRAGVDHLVLVDVHSPQLEGFFHIPVDHLTAVPLLAAAAREHVPAGTVVVSPDAGRVKLATEYARRLGAPLAVLLKRRVSGGETRVTQVVGEVRDRPCLLVDDMISTGGTIVESARALRDAGARDEIHVAATHALMVGDACTRFAREGIRSVIHADSVVPRAPCDVPTHVVSLAPLLAAAIAEG